MNFNLIRINVFFLITTLVLFGFYIYQTISISSGNVNLVNLKKEFLERKNNINLAGLEARNQNNFDPILLKEDFKMTEIERFDYLILGPSEFALIEDTSRSGNQ